MDAVNGYRQQHNPGRPLSWRWQRAFFLSSCGRLASSQDDDPTTISAVRFLAAARAGQARAALDRKWPGLTEALALAGPCDRRQRWKVQARLLAGQDDDAIAARCGLAPAAVQWYERLFFNIRDRLAARDWIALRAIGPGLSRGFRATEVGGVWRAFGYYLGSLALETIIPLTRDGLPIGSRVSQSDDDDDDTLPAALRRATLAMMLPANADPMRLFEMHLHLLQMERCPKGSEAARRARQQISAIMESLVAAGACETATAPVCEADADVPTDFFTTAPANPEQVTLDHDRDQHIDTPVISDPMPPQTVCRRTRAPRKRLLQPPGLQAAADDVVVAGSNQP